MVNKPLRVLLTLVALIALAQSGAHAERTSDLSFVKAPPLLSIKADKVDLGVWDDAYAFSDEDVFVLRNGDDFYLLPPTGNPQPTRICSVPGTGSLKVTCGVTFGKRLWLFCEARTTAAGVPCAIDGRTGLRYDFDIRGMDAPVTRGAKIESWTILPHAGGAMFMVSGGPEKTWPRDGNRPLFFWFDLRSGEIRPMPIGWDLFFFSADQATAVFETDQQQPGRYRELAAISMKIGAITADVPDRDKDFWIPYAWSHINRIQFVVTPRKSGEGDAVSLAGLSIDGARYPFKLPGLDGQGGSVASPYERNGRIVFRVVPSGSLPGQPMPCWTQRLKKDSALLELDSRTGDCALTGAQTGVFAAIGFGSRGDSMEAFSFNAETKQAWNPLDGIERLPAFTGGQTGESDLGEIFSFDGGRKQASNPMEVIKRPPEPSREADWKSCTEDRMSVELVHGTGDRRYPKLVLCLYHHSQGDLRASIPGPGETRMPWRRWHHSVLLAPDQRYETGLFQEGVRPEFLWVLNCGKIIFGGRASHADPSGNATAMRLYLVATGSGSRT